MATSMATRKVMASASVARRLAVPLYRHASTSTAPSPSQPSTSSLASPIKADKTSTFRELKLALIDRTLAVAREAGLVRMTDAEATVVRNQERDALIGKKGVDPGLVPKKKGKKPRKKSLRYMSEDEIAAMERAKAEALEEKEEVKFVRQKALEHPGIKALQLSEHTASVTLELAAASSHDLKQFPELHDFAVGPLPAVMWANPSTDFTISFGQPADALVVTTVLGSKTAEPIPAGALTSSILRYLLIIGNPSGNSTTPSPNVVLDAAPSQPARLTA